MIGPGRTPARAAVLALTLLIASCASLRPAELDGTRWHLVGWKGDPLELENTSIRVTFSGGRLSGSGGLNGYQGPYETTTNGLFCAGSRCGGGALEGVWVTQVASNDPEGRIDRIESRYLGLLLGAAAYNVRGDTLTLYDSLGTEVLSFARSSP